MKTPNSKSLGDLVAELRVMLDQLAIDNPAVQQQAEKHREKRVKAGVPDYEWHRELDKLIEQLADACWDMRLHCDYWQGENETDADKSVYNAALADFRRLFSEVREHLATFETEAGK